MSQVIKHKCKIYHRHHHHHHHYQHHHFLHYRPTWKTDDVYRIIEKLVVSNLSHLWSRGRVFKAFNTKSMGLGSISVAPVKCKILGET